MVEVEMGQYIAGSTPEEREQAYDDHAVTTNDDSARASRLFEGEEDRHVVRRLPGFRIDQQPVSNAAYAEYVRATGAALPGAAGAAAGGEAGGEAVSGLPDDPLVQSIREQATWSNDSPPLGREDHPVVLVSWHDAREYCTWRGQLVGTRRRLPSAGEFEKAVRGPAGQFYPWGNLFDASKLHSRASGAEDLTTAGSFSDGASVYGMLDAAGNVYHWTSTRWHEPPERVTLKGSSWHDPGGVGRGASQRPAARDARDPRIGFRCAADL